MLLARTLSMFLFQGADTASSDSFHWLVVLVGVIAFCSFVQFLVFVGAAIAGLKAYKSISAELALVKHKAIPIMASVQGVLEDTRPVVKKVSLKVQEIMEDAAPKIKVVTTKVQEIVEEATPKVKTVTTNIADISDVAREKVHTFEATLDKANQTLQDANSKTRAQVDKVDGIVSSALKTTSDISNTVQRGIRMPVMEVAGVVNGLKAAIDVLAGRAKSAAGAKTPKPASSAYPGPGRYSQAASRGPVAVPSPGSETAVSMDPSSAVAPSPGAQEVVDRFHNEKIKTNY